MHNEKPPIFVWFFRFRVKISLKLLVPVNENIEVFSLPDVTFTIHIKFLQASLVSKFSNLHNNYLDTPIWNYNLFWMMSDFTAKLIMMSSQNGNGHSLENVPMHLKNDWSKQKNISHPNYQGINMYTNRSHLMNTRVRSTWANTIYTAYNDSWLTETRWGEYWWLQFYAVFQLSSVL